MNKELSNQSISDEEILRYLRSPKEANKGYTLLLEKYQERLYWHIRKMVTFHDDAHDVIQNTFIKVFKNIKGFRQDSGLYTWMYRIATNESISYLRKRKRIQSNVVSKEILPMQDSLTSDPYFDGEAISALLAKAMETLPEKQKAVFQLRYFEEMPYKQMSEVMGTSEGSLKASYHHAVKKIEKYLKLSYLDL